jgi:hypothetical protein
MPTKPAKRSQASRKGCWTALPPAPNRYAVSWDVPGRRTPAQIHVGIHEPDKLAQRIVSALEKYPDACLQVRLV